MAGLVLLGIAPPQLAGVWLRLCILTPTPLPDPYPYPEQGCTDSTGMNYMLTATEDSPEAPCNFPNFGCMAEGALNHVANAACWKSVTTTPFPPAALSAALTATLAATALPTAVPAAAVAAAVTTATIPASFSSA